MELSLGCLGLCLHKRSPPCQPGGSFPSVEEEVEAQKGSDTAIKPGSQDLSPGLPWLGHQVRLPLEVNKTSNRNICRPGAACEPAAGPVGLQKGSGRSQEWRRQGSQARVSPAPDGEMAGRVLQKGPWVPELAMMLILTGGSEEAGSTQGSRRLRRTSPALGTVQWLAHRFSSLHTRPSSPLPTPAMPPLPFRQSGWGAL